MIKVFLADDHVVVRKGLVHIVGETPDLDVVGEAGNGDEVLEKVRACRPDVVILDLNMPGKSGLDLLKQIKYERPELPVLILSMHPEDQYGIRVLRAGAAGYLNKESAPEQLVAAIRKVAGGGRFISLAIAEQLLYQMDMPEGQDPHESLSDREFQVMRLIASGKSVGEIADELCLSVKTVSTYRARLLEKMNLKNNAELTHYAIKNNLVM